MQTHWGEIAVNDAHVHLFSQRFFEVLRSQRPASDESVDSMVQSLGWETPPADAIKLAAQWVGELDRQGVDRCALIASIPGDEASAVAAIQAYPERFWGYFLFDPTKPDAGERAARAFDEGLQGLCLFPAMQGFSVRDESLTPVYKAAAERPGTLVFVHCGVLSVGVRKKLGLASKFDMSRSNPLDLHRVALEYPQVNFVVPHFGAGFFREALMLADLCPNVYLDTSSSNTWTKYLTPPPTLEDVFGQALNVIGPDRLLFGSDSSFFPRGWNRAVFENQSQTLEKRGITAEVAANVFGGNLARLLARD
ncbi:MAG: amidohydrolase family protein [Acidobacteria bacterium]|nr:amidohydrolase family protein [Acidobacteriota bacterium]MDA1234535.1 amidohydrolase family protein [Acidobacteriota bacterium]